ncbi:MAG TPA: protein phosphatase 2C domain-containing protein [Kofleriaceae bacterium]|nr:protein phosphatase 2C domain-containing protein [Kofleriaceae bacterium]
MSALSIKSAGDSHRGTVRDANEDALIVDPKWGLYAVLDGMGGALSGDVASNKARDVIHEYVRARRTAMTPRALIEAAINAASAAVHGEAQRRRDRKGMGTTVVACLVDGRRATIAHVGDSRAYLLRDGRLHRLTNDHTVVAELVARGAIAAHEADHHAYKNVLSRNLGAKPTAQADVSEVELQPGDRLLLCSDGLYGYASGDAVHHLVASTDPPEEVVRDLIEAALRGGGGDNVTAIVVEAGVAAVPRATMVLRTTGAGSWWARRDRFLAACRAAGVHRSPLCAVLAPEEAIAIVAGNFADAVYHDLEKVTGVNVWTFAENLAQGWLGQGGGWPPLRDLLDGLARAADQVLAELRAEDSGLAGLVEVAVARALVTAETAVGGVLAERLRSIEGELVQVEADRTQRNAASGRVDTARFVETPTIPYLRAPAPATEVPAPEVGAVLDVARRRALAQPAAAAGAGDRALFARAVEHAHRVAGTTGGDGSDAAVAARELWDVRTLDEAGVSPLFDALDHARRAHLDAVRAAAAAVPARAAALRRVAAAYQRLSAGIATLVVGSVAPAAEHLREVGRETARLRSQVSQNEARIAELERRLATVVDAAAPSVAGAGDTIPSPAPASRRRVIKETQRS